MKRSEIEEYVGHYVDDALSPQPFDIDSSTRLVVYQCGFEPMAVAVRSYLGTILTDDEAEDLASDLLTEIGWWECPRPADYIL